jgi:peptidyl-prolyl cis-trans isomerase D
MQVGEVKGPVKTQFGYHVIQLEEIEKPHVRSFEEVRAELEPEYRREQAQNAFYDKAQQLADESFAALSELDSVARKLGMTVQTVEGFTRQGGGALGTSGDVIDAAFSNEVLVERQNSAPIPVGEESVVVLRVTDHQPAKERPLDEVRDEITARLREEGARKAAADAAQALAQRVNAGEALATVAATAGAEATAMQPVTRAGPQGETAAPIAPEMLKAIFQAPRPAAGKVSAGTTTLASGDQAVFVVAAARPGDPVAQLAQIPDLAQRLSQQTAAVELNSYLDELRRNAKIKRNDKLFATE